MGNFPKFRPKKSKLFLLLETWHTWYLGGAYSESGLRFSEYNPKVYLWANLYNPKVYLWANLGQKNKSCPFRLKIATHGILEELIPNPDLDFRNSDPKIHFYTIWAKKGFPLYSSLRTCCCFWAYSWFWFHILKLLSILMRHLTGGSESTMCLYLYFVVYTYIHIQQYIYIYIYIYI